MAGKTQGTGKVVHELISEGDFTNATNLTQSQYGSVSQYYSTTETATSGTSSSIFSFNGTQWESKTSAMTSNRYYSIKFTISTAGYYQFCYEASAGDVFNRLYLFNGSTPQSMGGSNFVTPSTTGTTNKCFSLGYVSANTVYRVVQRAYKSTYNPFASFKFSFKKATGTKTIDTGYRYEGKNPNNYVWFNNELWRMIGVFDENTHAQNDDTSTSVKENQLVKLIRANPIGGFSLNNATSSNWSGAMLYKLLNPVSGDANSGVYYNKKNGMENSYCYAYYPTVPGKCDFTNIGLDSTYRNMINPVMWKSGARSGSLLSEIYNSERTTDTVNTYIGLIYLSDYGFSVLESNCPRSTNMGSYNSPSCAGQSWLFGQGDEWVLSASSYGDYIRYDGINYSSDPTEDKAVRPTIYLNANVYAIGGTGTEIDPYIIAM